MAAASIFDRSEGDFKLNSFLLDDDVESLTDLMPEMTDMDMMAKKMIDLNFDLDLDIMDLATDKTVVRQMSTMYLDDDDDAEEWMCDTPRPNEDEDYFPLNLPDPMTLLDDVEKDLSAGAPKPKLDPFFTMCKPVDMDEDDVASGLCDAMDSEEVIIGYRHDFMAPGADEDLESAIANLSISDGPRRLNNAGPARANFLPYAIEGASVVPWGMKSLWKEQAEGPGGRRYNPASPKFTLKALLPSSWEARR